jgi:hypothetical protein
VKRVSRAFLEQVAADNGRLIEFDRAEDRAYLRVSGQVFFAELTYAPRHRADVAVDSLSRAEDICGDPLHVKCPRPKHRAEVEAVGS